MGDNLIEDFCILDGVNPLLLIFFLGGLGIPRTIALLGPTVLTDHSAYTTDKFGPFHHDIAALWLVNVALNCNGFGRRFVIASHHPHLNPRVLAFRDGSRHFLPHNVLDPKQTQQGQSRFLNVMHPLLILRYQIHSLREILIRHCQCPQRLLRHPLNRILDFLLQSTIHRMNAPIEVLEIAAGLKHHLGCPFLQQPQLTVAKLYYKAHPFAH